MKKELAEKLKSLKEYFEKRPEVEMAFLFGSRAKGQETSESDADVAVYFKPKTGRFEWEEAGEYENENKIWNEVESILGIPTDFVVLNRAPSTLADSVMREGRPIIIKNKKRYLDFFLAITSIAVDFREFVKDFWEIKQRSRSLSEQDKERLIRTCDFLEAELKDSNDFKNLDQWNYEENHNLRRSAERWAENIVNASVDMAKIILASRKKRIPQTYNDVLRDLALISGFDKEMAAIMADFTKLRNILAHEYLDIRFKQIKKFIDDAQPAYQYLLNFAKNLLKNSE